MATSQQPSAVETRTVDRRITELRANVARENTFRECGATSDLDFRMSDARLAGLRAEIEALKEIRGDL